MSARAPLHRVAGTHRAAAALLTRVAHAAARPIGGGPVVLQGVVALWLLHLAVEIVELHAGEVRPRRVAAGGERRVGRQTVRAHVDRHRRRAERRRAHREPPHRRVVRVVRRGRDGREGTAPDAYAAQSAAIAAAGRVRVVREARVRVHNGAGLELLAAQRRVPVAARLVAALRHERRHRLALRREQLLLAVDARAARTQAALPTVSASTALHSTAQHT